VIGKASRQISQRNSLGVECAKRSVAFSGITQMSLSSPEIARVHSEKTCFIRKKAYVLLRQPGVAKLTLEKRFCTSLPETGGRYSHPAATISRSTRV